MNEKNSLQAGQSLILPKHLCRSQNVLLVQGLSKRSYALYLTICITTRPLDIII